jgi:NDP-sugar pyrophosphorylase family protein
MNGDLLTTIDFKELFDIHIKQSNILTISTFTKKVNIDLGVIELDSNNQIIDYIEKPTLDYNVSMGIYVMNKSVLQYIPYQGAFDLPDLVLKLIEVGENVGVYQFSGEWLDIGRPEDYETAMSTFDEKKGEFLRE